MSDLLDERECDLEEVGDHVWGSRGDRGGTAAASQWTMGQVDTVCEERKGKVL